MTGRRYPTIRLSCFGAATTKHPSAESVFFAWLSGEAAPPVPIQQPEDNLWRTLTTQAVTAALPPLEDRDNCGLILATTKGDMHLFETWLNFGSRSQWLSAPPLLSDNVHVLARRFGLGGPKMVVSTACSSGLTAIIEAAMMVGSQAVNQMVVCAADVAGGFVQDGFHALKAITRTRCRPFDRQRDGLALGSAAAACLVTSSDRPQSRMRGPSILLEGWGMSCDATHLTAPDREASGLIRAINQALACMNANDIDAVILHGTGTAYNDAMEALAVRRVFNHRPHLTAAKGFLGHTLGASGVIETALAAWMLDQQVIPAITGLEDPQWPELNFVRTSEAAAPLKRILKTASGFGGLNAAVVLGI